MDAERRARAPLPRASARTLGALLLLGVRAPHRLRPDTVGAIAGLLRTPGLGAAVYNGCLRVLGAIIYGRPALADASVVDSVKALFDMAGIPPAALRLAGDVLQFFIGTPAAPPAVAALEELLAEPRLAPAVHQRLIEPLSYAASWRMELIGLERLAALASAEHLARHRNFLLANLIERAAFWAPEAFTPALLDRLADVGMGHGPEGRTWKPRTRSSS